jgi:hypothetical protein
MNLNTWLINARQNLTNGWSSARVVLTSYSVMMAVATSWTVTSVYPAGALLANTSARIAFLGLCYIVVIAWQRAIVISLSIESR